MITTVVVLLVLGMTSQAYSITDSCRCVAFRLDDIQDYFLNNIQKQIIETVQTKDSNLTVGIIGNYFGNDTSIVNLLKENLVDTNNSLEIANHGWNHEDFTAFDKHGQELLIKKTNEKIWNLLQVKPVGFIPPFNKINNDTMTVLRENNFRYVSANMTQDLLPYKTKNDSLYHFPSSSITGDLNSDNTAWYGKSHKETFAQIQISLINHGFAIVTLHPQEYSKRQGLEFTNEVDSDQIHDLEMLIDVIKNNGLEIVTISEIPQYITFTQKAPSWINQIFEWYENKEISTDEVINAIKFLTENKIIKFNS